ncbi:hypothetical protein [Phormidium sp. CCY1219]|uniref:hypothetical protein n=1 Tax=Phormidium sp. CCY1219 TaxID=2886104 RepID=UPI002D1EC79E|nr:hypothetical protein [Phormidium sp. CCY1219]MEB3826908.1 hypothetical protein [Phormidium sp. CCY1219]
MKTDSEIRLEGMQALISTLGLVEAERFILVMTRDRFDYTQWRQEGLPKISLKELADAADALAHQLNNSHQGQ